MRRHSDLHQSAAISAVLLVLLTMGLVYAFGYWRLHREGLRRQALERRLQDVTANLPAVVYRARRSSTHASTRPNTTPPKVLG